MSKKHEIKMTQFWGGPLDGTPLPAVIAEAVDYLEITVVYNSVDTVHYLYEYRADTDDFEYVGEEHD